MDWRPYKQCLESHPQGLPLTTPFVSDRREIKYLVGAAEAEEFKSRATDLFVRDAHDNGNGYLSHSVYFDSPDLTFSSFVRFGRSGSAGGSAALSLGRRQSPGSVEPALPGKRSWDKGEGKTKAEEKEHYEDELESWMANSRGAAEKRALDYVKNRAYKEAAAKEAEETAKKQGTWNYTKEREEGGEIRGDDRRRRVGRAV